MAGSFLMFSFNRQSRFGNCITKGEEKVKVKIDRKGDATIDKSLIKKSYNNLRNNFITNDDAILNGVNTYKTYRDNDSLTRDTIFSVSSFTENKNIEFPAHWNNINIRSNVRNIDVQVIFSFIVNNCAGVQTFSNNKSRLTMLPLLV